MSIIEKNVVYPNYTGVLNLWGGEIVDVDLREVDPPTRTGMKITKHITGKFMHADRITSSNLIVIGNSYNDQITYSWSLDPENSFSDPFGAYYCVAKITKIAENFEHWEGIKFLHKTFPKKMLKIIDEYINSKRK